MSFSVGIIGLPNVGKSTLFKALTKHPVDISNYPFTTIDPNVGVVGVPDERLDTLADLLKPEKIVPTTIEFVDIAGLVKEAHKGEGLGNQFLAHIREVDMILHVVRAFEDENITHIETTVDPKRDIEIIKTEIRMKDLETCEKYFETLAREIKSGNKKAEEEGEILKTVRDRLTMRETLDGIEGIERLGHLQLLSAKKMITVVNTKNPGLPVLQDIPDPKIAIDIKLEEELSELTEEEAKEIGQGSQLPYLISLCYKTLTLRSFFTIKGGKELRSWTLGFGQNARDAAYRVHTDFGKKFIKADTVSYEQLRKDESWTNAREQGHVRTEGKEYVVKDGDILEFKI